MRITCPYCGERDARGVHLSRRRHGRRGPSLEPAAPTQRLVRLRLSARQPGRAASRALVSQRRLPAWLVVTRDTRTHAIDCRRARARRTRSVTRMSPSARRRRPRSTAPRRCRFTFDGERYRGFAGDTLASALLANGVRLVGRSFKYHRPRGILTAGSEEPNALVELRSGARREPNTRATTVELYDGLEADEPEPLALARLRPAGGQRAARRRSSAPASTTRPSCGRRRSGRSSTSR